MGTHCRVIWDLRGLHGGGGDEEGVENLGCSGQALVLGGSWDFFSEGSKGREVLTARLIFLIIIIS